MQLTINKVNYKLEDNQLLEDTSFQPRRSPGPPRATPNPPAFVPVRPWRLVCVVKNAKAEKAEGWEKLVEWFLKHATTPDLLNWWRCTPTVSGGKVTALVHGEDNDELTDEQYKQLNLDRNNLGTVDAHPEGSDRGGYVPTLSSGYHYDENGGEWG